MALSNVDAKLREEMQGELRRIQRWVGTTTILVTHDQHEAMALSDRIVLMNQGRVEQIGTPDAIYARPSSAFVAHFLGKTNILQGRGDGCGHVVIGPFSIPVAGAGAGTVALAVRPERLSIDAPGAPGFPGPGPRRGVVGRWGLGGGGRVCGSTGGAPVVSRRASPAGCSRARIGC